MAAIRAPERGAETFWTDRFQSLPDRAARPQQALPARTAFVAVGGGDLVGFVAGHKTRRFGCEGELQGINGVKEKCSLGVADRLMTEIGAWFATQGHDAFEKRRSFERDSTQTYTRCGAQILNEHWMAREDARVMCKSRDV